MTAARRRVLVESADARTRSLKFLFLVGYRGTACGRVRHRQLKWTCIQPQRVLSHRGFAHGYARSDWLPLNAPAFAGRTMTTFSAFKTCTWTRRTSR